MQTSSDSQSPPWLELFPLNGHGDKTFDSVKMGLEIFIIWSQFDRWFSVVEPSCDVADGKQVIEQGGKGGSSVCGLLLDPLLFLHFLLVTI
jgi:hypothetical protein